MKLNVATAINISLIIFLVPELLFLFYNKAIVRLLNFKILHQRIILISRYVLFLFHLLIFFYYYCQNNFLS